MESRSGHRAPVPDVGLAFCVSMGELKSLAIQVEVPNSVCQFLTQVCSFLGLQQILLRLRAIIKPSSCLPENSNHAGEGEFLCLSTSLLRLVMAKQQ